MGIMNHFLTELKSHSTVRNPYLAPFSGQASVAGKVTGHRREPTAIILLNGHETKSTLAIYYNNT